jgi:hypothetical protein
MSARNKLLIGIAALTVLTVAGSVAAYQTFGGMGMMVVDVQEKLPGGDRVHVEMPAVLIPMTMMCIPDFAHIECDVDDDEARYVGPIMRAISSELRKMPDAEIIHVETSDETVSVVKDGQNLIVDVDTPQETVHITLPIRAMESVSKKVDRIIRNST